MEEVNLRKCKICGEMKQRILDGKFDDKNKRWKDETGKVWNGSICPRDHARIQAELQKLRRLSKSSK